MIRALALIITLSCLSRAYAQEPLRVQLIGLNDFHGQLTAGKKLGGRPVGGASALAAYVRRESEAKPTLIIHAGDWVGASPPESALLQDEPAVEFLGLLGNAYCTRARPYHPRCNVVGTPGNHEFDEGVAEMLRLLRGGNHRHGPFLVKPWRGARVSYVSANVVDRAGAPLLPPFVIKEVGAAKLGVIGATLMEAPSMVVARGVSRVRFLPEAAAINARVRTLKKRGIRAIVVTIHQGGAQVPYEGATRPDVAGPSAGIADIVRDLDDEVDVVISGHAHAFTNALLNNANGHPILVTQSLSAGQALSVIDLTLAQGDVVEKSARVLVTYADAGLAVPREVDELVQRAAVAVAPMTARVIGHADVVLPQDLDAAGNSMLGNLIADAQRAAMKAQIAFMNQGGIRAELAAGDVTWGQLFAVQPFSNIVMALELSGAQVRRVLEQQWLDPQHVHRLAVSGLSYRWDPAAPPGARIQSIRVGERELDDRATYRVAVNNFLAEGGSGFAVFKEGAREEAGPVDLDALLSYLVAHGFPSVLEPRAAVR